MTFKSIIPVLSLAFLCSCGLDPVNSKPDSSSPNTQDQSSTQADPKTTEADPKTEEDGTTGTDPDTDEEGNTEPDSSSEADTSTPDDPDTTTSSEEPDTGEDKGLVLQADKSAVWFIGAKEKFERVGTFREITGKAVVKDDVLESLEVQIPTASVNTPFVRLTEHMLNDHFFHVEKFASASFRSTKIRKLPVEDSEEELPNYEIQGKLQILAVTKEIDFVATVAVENDKVVHRASFEINRKDFGMNYDGKPEDPIFDEVKLEIDLSFAAD